MQGERPGLDVDFVLSTVKLLVNIFVGKMKLLNIQMEATTKALKSVSADKIDQVYESSGPDNAYQETLLKKLNQFAEWASDDGPFKIDGIWTQNLSLSPSKHFPGFIGLVPTSAYAKVTQEQLAIVNLILTTLRSTIKAWSDLRKVQNARKLLRQEFDCATFMSKIADTTEMMYRSLDYIHKHFLTLEDDKTKMFSEIQKLLE
jgi:hypothetical protein